MPTLNWIGKDKVINHHNEVPYRLLERKYGYGNGEKTNEDNDSPNMRGKLSVSILIHPTIPEMKVGYTTIM